MIDTGLRLWLDQHAVQLDQGLADEESVLPKLAEAGLLRLGVAEQWGGEGQLVDALESVAAVAEHSLTAAFVLWAQRAFIEYLQYSDNTQLVERLLPDLLVGRQAGATGLSNAMKFLCGIEELGVRATPHGEGWKLDGRLPWVTNLRKGGFVVAAAVELPGGKPFIAALPDDLLGFERSADLRLLALQGSNTAALKLDAVDMSRDWLIDADALSFLPRVRPSFLGLQCGMSLGLARRCLSEAGQHLSGCRTVLDGEYRALQEQLAQAGQALSEGLADGRFAEDAASLFRLRIRLAELAADALQLELQASGGRAYLLDHGEGFARRWREAAFVPVVTPSLVQLRTQLQASGAAA